MWKKSVQYTCIAYINGKKCYKNGKKKELSTSFIKRIKKIKISEFKDVELETDPCPDSE